MLTLMNAYLSTERLVRSHQLTGSHDEPLLSFILTNLVKDLQKSFCRFADCGAGIGWTSQEFANLLNENLSKDVNQQALVACYEPLPENFIQMRKNLVGDIYALHKQAVADVAGTADFNVPSRMGAEQHRLWTEGTSYGGTLAGFPTEERIKVETIRLQDSYKQSFDFIKLDLQGGEMKALLGLGDLVQEVKMLYVETQLLSPALSTDYLNKKGFITFFSGIQFGMLDNAEDVPISILDSLGIEVMRARSGKTDGFPLILWGRFKPTADLFDRETLSFRKDVSDRLISLGVSYMQTEVFAFKPSIFPMIMRYFV